MNIKSNKLLITGSFLFAGGVFLASCPILDIKLGRILLLSADNNLVPYVKLIAKSGSFSVIMPLTVLISAGLWFRKRKIDAIWFLSSLVASRIFFLMLKFIVQRSRPLFPDRLVHSSNWSFPSGHAVNSLSFFILCYILFAKNPKWIVVVLIWGGLIGWSRVALGAHWYSDVIAGWGGALLCTGLASKIRYSELFQEKIKKLLGIEV